MWGLIELSRQVMIEIPGPAPCVVCGSQWSTGVRNTIVTCILLNLRCTPASSVLPKLVQGRSWISTIERSMLGKGHFSVAFVKMPSNISRTCPTTSRWSTRSISRPSHWQCETMGANLPSSRTKPCGRRRPWMDLRKGHARWRKFMNQNEKLKVVVIELLDSLSNDIAEFLFDRTGCVFLLTNQFAKCLLFLTC